MRGGSLPLSFSPRTNLSNVSGAVQGVVVVALVVLTATALIWSGIIPIPLPPREQAGPPEGNISVTLAYTDVFLNSACTCTGVTNKNLYHTSGAWPVTNIGQLQQVGTGLSTTATTIGVLALYNGILALWANSGITTDFVVPASTIKDSGGLIADSTLIDLDADGNVDVLFKIDLNLRGVNQDSAVGVSLVVRTMDEDLGNNALSNPSDQDSIGTGSKTVTVEWKYGKTATTNIADNVGMAIGRVFVTSNETTFESLATLKQLTIIFDGQVFKVNRQGTITPNVGAKQWDIDIGVANYRQTFYGTLIGRKAGDPGTISLTAVFESFFTVATEAITVTLKVDGARPDDVLDTQLTDAVILGG